MCNGVVELLQKSERGKMTGRWRSERCTETRKKTRVPKLQCKIKLRRERHDKEREEKTCRGPKERERIRQQCSHQKDGMCIDTRSSLNSIKANQFPKMSADIKRVQGEWERGRERANHIYHQCDLLITASKCSLKNQHHQHTRHKHNIFSPVGKTFRMPYKRLMIVFSFANRILAVDKLSLST